MERVIAYVDGYNLYYGLRAKGWRRFYWLNVQAMVEHLLKPDQTLVTVKYFTTIVKHPADRNKRQMVFLEALRTLSDFEIYYGHFLSDRVVCRNCGYTYETYHEKMTDVNISVQLMSDVFQDRFDVVLIISADSDLVGPVQAVRRLSRDKRVIVAFPPERFSSALKRIADGHLFINRDVLAKSQFPDAIAKPAGFVLRRPERWH